MEYVLWIILIYILFLAFIIYVFMCGNTTFHRDGIIGSFYRFFTKKIPTAIAIIFNKIIPKRIRKSRHSNHNCFFNCCSNFLRYLIIFFFYLIYLFFIFVNFCNVYPKADEIFKDSSLYLYISILVLPFPWIFVIVLNCVDPGTITPTNVRSYLEIYPYDNVIYKPAVCKTTKLPVVPRSRDDRFTGKRIAFVFKKKKSVIKIITFIQLPIQFHSKHMDKFVDVSTILIYNVDEICDHISL